MIALCCPALAAQEKSLPGGGEFKQLAAQLSTARLDGTTESQSNQDRALGILDGIVLAAMGGSSTPDLTSANERLATLVSHTPPVGENYRLVRLGGSPASYALVVNFGLGGPAAVRVYGAVSNRLALVGRIDHFVQKDFFDSDVDLFPIPSTEAVFITVSGRTDDLATGIFSAWRFDGHEVSLVWTSDILQQSSYELDANGFHLTYCSEPDADHPSQCPKMATDLYQWQAGQWKRLETKTTGPSKTSNK
jgi:hypothetical protein